MKILVTDSLAPEGLAVFENAEGFTVDVKLGLKPDELKKICADYDGWVIRSGTRITAELIDAAKNLKVIGRAGVGYENIDADAATKRGIVVMNTPGGNNVTTGEHTVALMMALARHIPKPFRRSRPANGNAINSSASSSVTKPSASSVSATSVESLPNARPD